jgi:hypothetical protein
MVLVEKEGAEKVIILSTVSRIMVILIRETMAVIPVELARPQERRLRLLLVHLLMPKSDPKGKLRGTLAMRVKKNLYTKS